MPPADGLALPWRGSTWINPPYSDPRPWVKRAANHRGRVCMLLKADTSTAIWRDVIWPHASAVLFLYARVRFASPANPDRGATAKWPSAIVLFNWGPVPDTDLGKLVRL